MQLNERCKKLYLLLFVVVICLPQFWWLLLGNYMNSSNAENREMASKPTFDISAYENYPLEYEAYFNDHLPFRNELISSYSWVNYCIFHASTNDDIILGKDKWLFYKEGLASYEGLNLYSESEIYDLREEVLRVQTRLAKMGIQLSIIIPTDKERIYMQYMPEGYTPSEFSRTDLMIMALQQEGINIINPKKDLDDLKSNYPLYYMYDTHWNQLGAYIGTCNVLQSWGIETTNLSELTILSSELRNNYHLSGQDDLAKALNLRDTVFNDEMEYSILENYNDIDWAELTDGLEYIYFENRSAPNHKTVLLLGDSFRVSMIPALSTYFTDIYVIHRNVYTHNILEEIDPDYLLVEYVERNSAELSGIERLIFEQ